jgi:tetratricopeptide (TPR) repeat protein
MTDADTNAAPETTSPAHIYQVPGFWAAVVFTLSLVAHGFYVYETAAHPFFTFPLVDSQTYDVQAWSIRDHGWLGSKIFWQAPLYPYFLAFFYQFFERDYRFFDIRIVQALMAALNALLLYRIGRRRIGLAVGVGAGLAAAFYAPLVYFDTEMLAPVLIVFFYSLMAITLDKATGQTGTGRPAADGHDAWWLGAGLLNGLAALAHGLALLIAPLIFFHALLRKPVSARRLLAAGLFGLGVAAMIAPVTIRNRLVGGEWVLISHNGPINLFIGNHPDYDRMVELRPGTEWSSLQKALDEAGIDTVSGEARHFLEATLANARTHPGALARVWLKKIRLLLHADEIRRNFPIYPIRDYSAFMRLSLWKWRGPGGVLGLGFPFGIVLPLALIGWWTLRRVGLRLTAVELILVGHVAANLLFFICSRYRVPIAPFLVLYAAAAVHWAARERIWRPAALRRNAWLVAAALAVFLFSNAGLTPMGNARDRGEYQFFLGLVAHKHRRQHKEALEHCQAALRDLPEFTEARTLLGVLYCDHFNEPDKALEQFDWLLERNPGNMELLFYKAVALARKGERAEARAIVDVLVENARGRKKYVDLQKLLSEKPTTPQSENRTREDDVTTSPATPGAGPLP